MERSPTRLLLIVVLGVGFGFAMNRGGVHQPGVIASQFRFTHIAMIKFFVAALSASMASFALVRLVDRALFDRIRAQSSPNSVVALVVGGALIGAGMAAGGTCPGSIFVQIGAGITTGITSLVGALVGVIVLAFVKPVLTTTTMMVSSTIDRRFNTGAGRTLAIVAAGLAVVAVVMELMVDWRKMSASSWPPTVAGAMLGSLQIPLVAIFTCRLGASASYLIVVALIAKVVPSLARLVGPPDGVCSSYFADDANRFQLVFAVGSALGSAIATYTSSPSPFKTSIGHMDAFLGGLLVELGARLAGGCTSGHGLSGAGLLNLTSWTVVVAMFGFGTIVAFVLGPI